MQYYVAYHCKDLKYAAFDDTFRYFWSDDSDLFLTYNQICNNLFESDLKLMILYSQPNVFFVPITIKPKNTFEPDFTNISESDVIGDRWWG